MTISVVIPACNEEQSIGRVLDDIPDNVGQKIVVDNGSTDATARVAAGKGALVVTEPKRGYGRACQAGIAAAGACDILVILDADYSDFPEQLPRLTEPIIKNQADFVIGSRVKGEAEPGSLPLQVRWGNALATFLIRMLFKHRFTDMGPFRAIRYDLLRRMDMKDPDYGWNVEMQTKAVKLKARIREVPVNYRRRTGTSKISGTVGGTIKAGMKIIYSIFKYYFLLRKGFSHE